MGRPRKTTIETPGEEGAKEPTSPDQNPEKVIQQAPGPINDSLLDVIVEEAQKGNVELPANNSLPQIGAEWAGMVLTEHGWAAKPTGEKQE